MHVDVEALARWATALIAIVSFGNLVVAPFSAVMTRTRKTLDSLEETIKELSHDIRESQRDRENIHKTLDKHGDRLDKVEDEVIRIDTFCAANARKE